MAIRIRYIRTGGLTEYVSSDDFRHQDFEAISILRAYSHANNPRSKPDDVALLLAYDEEKLAGYLGAIPEILFKGDQAYEVCWYSCMWVSPEYRREGIAKMLLEDAGRHYGNRVFITNYISSSKAAFLKNDQFSEIMVLQGVRAYLRFNLRQYLPQRKPAFAIFRPVLGLMDVCGNLLTGIFIRPGKSRSELYSIKPVKGIDDELAAFIDQEMRDSPFRRGAREFEWLIKFPWVTALRADCVDPSRYYFSQFSPDFRQWMLEIRDRKGRISGFALLTRHKNILKTRYILGKYQVMPELFRFIYRLMKSEKISTLVSHSAKMVPEIMRHRRSFILLRPSEHGFMATPEAVELLKGEKGEFYEGDGDGMFT
ncbi:MAG: GNAT family N-acetyltransferase [Bacteroidales bacterium]|nr:GNAT family N-acetyltransferase [Bacteroidales bacterium]